MGIVHPACADAKLFVNDIRRRLSSWCCPSPLFFFFCFLVVVVVVEITRLGPTPSCTYNDVCVCTLYLVCFFLHSSPPTPRTTSALQGMRMPCSEYLRVLRVLYERERGSKHTMGFLRGSPHKHRVCLCLIISWGALFREKEKKVRKKRKKVAKTKRNETRKRRARGSK